MRTLRRSTLQALCFLTFTACTQYESIARTQLQQQIASQSGGALQLAEFTKTSGTARQFPGVRLFTLGWTARLTVKSDIWKGGNAFTGYWDNFSVMTAQPGMWDNLIGGGDSREFVKGATIVLTGNSQFQNVDGTWRVLGYSVESSRVLNNERSPEALAELQKQQIAAQQVAEGARAQAEQERATVAAREAAERDEAKRIRDSVIATARADTAELTYIHCEVRKEGTGTSFMIDSIVQVRYAVTATSITKHIIEIRSTRNQVWIKPADDVQEVVWFDELTAKPGYYRGNASSLDREIALQNERTGRDRLYCDGNRGDPNRADMLGDTFKVLESAIDAWRSKYPSLNRW